MLLVEKPLVVCRYMLLLHCCTGPCHYALGSGGGGVAGLPCCVLNNNLLFEFIVCVMVEENAFDPT